MMRKKHRTRRLQLLSFALVVAFLVGNSLWTSHGSPRVPLVHVLPVNHGVVRVLIITQDFRLQGAQMFVLRLARSLQHSSNVQVTVVSPIDGPLRQFFKKENIPVFVAQHGNINSFIIRNQALYDVLQFNTLLSCTFGSLPKFVSLPIVFSIHEIQMDPSVLQSCSGNDVVKLFVRAAWLTFPTRATREVYIDMLGSAALRHSVIPYGVDPIYYSTFVSSLSKESARYLIGADTNFFIILIVGTVEPRNGQLDVAKAAVVVKMKHNSINPLVLLIGESPNDKYNHEIRKAAGNIVRFEGVAKDPRPYYRAADVHVSHAFGQDLPFSLMEASLMGVPNIGTRNYGIHEIVMHDVTGLLYDMGNLEQLEAAIETLVLNTTLALQLGAAGTAFVASKFTFSAMRAAYTDVYNHIAVTGLLPPIEVPVNTRQLVPMLDNVDSLLFQWDQLRIPLHERICICYHLGMPVRGDSIDQVENNLRIFISGLNNTLARSTFIIYNVQGGTRNPLRQLLLDVLPTVPTSFVLDWEDTKSDMNTHAITASLLGPRAVQWFAFIALNQGVRGPMHDAQSWVENFIALFTPGVMLIGPTLSCEISPHIQTHMFAIRSHVFALFLQHELKSLPLGSWKEVIMHAEIGLTQRFMAEGFQVASLLYKKKMGAGTFSGTCLPQLLENNPTGWCDLSEKDVTFLKWGGNAFRLHHYCPKTLEHIDASTRALAVPALRLPEEIDSISSPTAKRFSNNNKLASFLACTMGGSRSWCQGTDTCIKLGRSCSVGPICNLPMLYNAQTTGLTKQLMNIRDMLAAASASSSSLLVGPIMYRDVADWGNGVNWKAHPFDKVFDLANFLQETNKYACTFYSGDVQLPAFMSQRTAVGDVVSKQYDARWWSDASVSWRRNNTHVLAITSAWASFLPKSSKELQLYSNFPSWFVPSDDLKGYVTNALTWLLALTNNQNYYGIHLRTEVDWPYPRVPPSHIRDVFLQCNVPNGSVIFIAGGHGSVLSELAQKNPYFVELCSKGDWRCITKADSTIQFSAVLKTFDIGSVVDRAILSSTHCKHFFAFEKSTFSTYIALGRMNNKLKLLSSFIHTKKTNSVKTCSSLIPYKDKWFFDFNILE